jgi:hypothetical protein
LLAHLVAAKARSELAHLKIAATLGFAVGLLAAVKFAFATAQTLHALHLAQNSGCLDWARLQNSIAPVDCSGSLVLRELDSKLLVAGLMAAATTSQTATQLAVSLPAG